MSTTDSDLSATSTAAARRLAEIAAEQRRLADEAAAIVAAMAAPTADASPPPTAPPPPALLDLSHLVPVAVAARRLRRSESWVRGWAKKTGAESRLGGGVLVDINRLLTARN